MQKVDVFISAKSSDFKQAKIVYDFLTANGLSVFFSEESLPKIGNADYRQQIDKALDATQHMVVVTSSKENVASDWVEAEWGLFINDKRSKIKQGKIITVITDKMDTRELPASLRYYEVFLLNMNGLERLLNSLSVKEIEKNNNKSNYKKILNLFNKNNSTLFGNINSLSDDVKFSTDKIINLNTDANPTEIQNQREDKGDKPIEKPDLNGSSETNNDISIPFEAYVGNEKYVFISYSHRDKHKVYPEISRLHDAGYKIWYDEGIDPGNEWPHEIAQAIINCAMFIVYISNNSTQSQNVANEINFAIKHNKVFIAIHIEDTTLPLGIDLTIGSKQAIYMWKMHSDTYIRKIDKALSPILPNT